MTFGGSYRFEPVTLYLQAQYFQGLNALDGFKVNRTSGSIEGYGIHAGTQFWLSGLSSWQSMVYWKDYKEKLNDGRSYDGNTLGMRVCNFLWAARSRLIDVGGDSVTK